MTILAEEEGYLNRGNFVEFRAEHDQILAQHLANAPRNATYTSKTIQNELIEVVGNCSRQHFTAGKGS